MTLFWINPSSFEEVEALYNSIKPLAGGQNKGKDIRPIWDRRRKIERVYKFSANCYALMDGGTGDPYTWWPTCRIKAKDREAIRFAPIVWRRHKDGSQTITIRNESGQGAHNSRYSFLERHIPNAMQFSVCNGKQFIVHGGEEYYLAKSTTFPAEHVRDVKARVRARNGKLLPWQRERTARDDGAALTFKRVSNYNFIFEAGGKEPPKAPRTLVKKAQKAKHKNVINDFWDWVVVIAPMMPVEDREYVWGMRKELAMYAHPERVGGIHYLSKNDITANIAIQILTDYNNPMRLNLAVDFVAQSDIKHAETVDDAKRVRAQYNRWINKICGFTVTK